ncbi:MAG: GDSL-type esterase/lipase family protein [Isosphaeraceae bacterium]
MRRRLFLRLSIPAGLHVLSGVASAAGTEPASLPKARALLAAGGPLSVICFGDSVTGVYYHTGSRRAYTDMLEIALRQAHPRARIIAINAGISGNTTRDALARIDHDVLDKRPDLVSVMFGLNDMTRVPVDEYRENLRAIVAKCRAANAEVILCTPNNVITTPDRPSERLRVYCDAVRGVGEALAVPVVDVHAAFEALRARDPRAWRLSLSDEIHPNMDGHRRIAELLAGAIAGRPVSLADVRPPDPALVRTGERLRAGEPIRVLAMPPFDAWFKPLLRAQAPNARVEVTSWPTGGMSLAELRADARRRVRPMAPDLVMIAVPGGAAADSIEEFIADYTWIMNDSLSFGGGGWDCVVVHPAVLEPGHAPDDGRGELVRTLVRAQDLTLIDRSPGDARPARELLAGWLARRPWDPAP